MLLVDGDGKVRSDSDFYFYNHAAAEDGSVQLLGKVPTENGSEDRISLDLTAIPSDVATVVVAASQYGGACFGDLDDLRMTVTDRSGEALLGFSIPDATIETAFIFGELYRRNDQWKFRAVGQGYETGLAGLATDFGITVDEGEDEDVEGAEIQGGGGEEASAAKPLRGRKGSRGDVPRRDRNRPTGIRRPPDPGAGQRLHGSRGIGPGRDGRRSCPALGHAPARPPPRNAHGQEEGHPPEGREEVPGGERFVEAGPALPRSLLQERPGAGGARDIGPALRHGGSAGVRSPPHRWFRGSHAAGCRRSPRYRSPTATARSARTGSSGRSGPGSSGPRSWRPRPTATR